MNVTTTERGFEVIKFQDRNGEQCSLQASSLATERVAWMTEDVRAGIPYLATGYQPAAVEA